MSRYASLGADTPIPPLAAAHTTKVGYRVHPIDSTAPEYTEALVNVSGEIPGSNYYARTYNPPYHQQFAQAIRELYVRTSVREKLLAVTEKLSTQGLALHLYDAWRPAALQHHMRNVWCMSDLRRRHPDWTSAEIEQEISQYWAVAVATEEEVDPASPPPHATGGAVDLGLQTVDGELLWMGTMFDDISKRAHTDALEQVSPERSYSDEEARQNRRILYWGMLEAGFANNPTEWWHFSYGDQMWAALTGSEKAALYGPTKPL